MKKTKLFASALCLGAATLALASCGGKTKQEVVFYCSAGNTIAPIIDAKIKEFNKTSDIKVKMTNPGNYDPLKEKVKSDLKVNNQPAIAYCYPDHVAEYLTGTYKNKVIKINERFADANDVASKLLPSYLEESKVYDKEGSIYSLPFQRSTECMYVNMQHLEAAGVKVEELATWEGLFAALPKLKTVGLSQNNTEGKPGSKEYKAALGYDSEDNLFITLCHQYGIPYTAAAATSEDKYLFNNDKAVKMLEDLNGVYREGKLFTTQEILSTYTSDHFKKGNISISIGSTGGANHQNPGEKFTYQVLPLPKPTKLAEDTNLKGQSVSQGPSLVMFEQKDDKIEETAWKFVKEVLLSDDLQVQFSTQSGYLPVTNSALDSQAFKDFCKGESIMAKTINVAAANKTNLFQSPAFNGSNTARNQVGVALAEAVKETNLSGADLTNKIKKLLAEAYETCAFFE